VGVGYDTLTTGRKTTKCPSQYRPRTRENKEIVRNTDDPNRVNIIS